MTTVPPTPDAVLLRWVRSIPAVRCVAPAFGPWTSGNIRAKDVSGVPITAVSGERFARAAFAGNVIAGLTVVAGSALGDTYWVARVPSVHAVVIHAGSEAQEDDFTAVFAGAGAPPRAVAALPSAPRAHGDIGLGSSRAAVEAALGAGRAKALCGFDVVRYEPRPAAASAAEMWFFYRAGRVVAFARYEAV
jgi:hypothetical protein